MKSDKEGGIVAGIFLCHAREDKTQVREVYHRLRAIEGLEPWMDAVAHCLKKVTDITLAG